MDQTATRSPDVRSALERYYAVLARRDAGGFADVVSADIVFDDDALRRAEVRGLDAFTGLFTAIWQALPDLTFTILDGPFLDEEDSRCMVHVRLTGTQNAPMPALGRTNAGGRVDLDMMTLYEFRDGLVSRVRVCCDPGVLDAQLSSD